jgi:hypothetical protein
MDINSSWDTLAKAATIAKSRGKETAEATTTVVVPATARTSANCKECLKQQGRL